MYAAGRRVTLSVCLSVQGCTYRTRIAFPSPFIFSELSFYILHNFTIIFGTYLPSTFLLSYPCPADNTDQPPLQLFASLLSSNFVRTSP
ncbi:hypothetical protein BJX62DRAFT_127996 [Aspergillus germanicus]